MPTEVVENYLKAIYELQAEHGKVATTMLAEHLQLAPASITGMIKKLAELQLVVHERYQGVALTEAGRKIALEVIRHHRLVELYLAEALGVPWDQVHAEAERWEHVLSEELEDRIDAVLGHPTTDPHGAPIPARNGTIIERATVRLSELCAGQAATVAEVSDRDPALLRYVGSLGLYPKTPVQVTAVAPFAGPLTLAVGAATAVLGREAASFILVTDVQTIA